MTPGPFLLNALHGHAEDNRMTVDVAHVPYTCRTCRYDLSGTAIGSACPECGTSVHESLERAETLPASGAAIASMVVGILSLVGCSLLGPVAIVLAVIAFRQIDDGQRAPHSRSLARAGLVLGIVATVMVVGGVVIAILLSQF